MIFVAVVDLSAAGGTAEAEASLYNGSVRGQQATSALWNLRFSVPVKFLQAKEQNRISE